MANLESRTIKWRSRETRRGANGEKSDAETFWRENSSSQFLLLHAFSPLLSPCLLSPLARPFAPGGFFLLAGPYLERMQVAPKAGGQLALLQQLLGGHAQFLSILLARQL